MMKRRVQYETYMKNQAGILEKLSGCGNFHKWGTAFEEFTNGGVEVTVAIVEMDDGRIVLCHPEKIKFVTE